MPMTITEVVRIAFVVWWVMTAFAIIFVSLGLKLARRANRRELARAARHAKAPETSTP